MAFDNFNSLLIGLSFEIERQDRNEFRLRGFNKMMHLRENGLVAHVFLALGPQTRAKAPTSFTSRKDVACMTVRPLELRVVEVRPLGSSIKGTTLCC